MTGAPGAGAAAGCCACCGKGPVIHISAFVNALDAVAGVLSLCGTIDPNGCPRCCKIFSGCALAVAGTSFITVMWWVTCCGPQGCSCCGAAGCECKFSLGTNCRDASFWSGPAISCASHIATIIATCIALAWTVEQQGSNQCGNFWFSGSIVITTLVLAGISLVVSLHS